MFFTNALRRLTFVLVSLLGLVILAGIFVWIDVFKDLINPTEIISAEDKYLGAGIFISAHYFAAVIEVIAMAVLTRCRWIPFKRGKTSVWLLSILGLLQILFYIWIIHSIRSVGFYPESVWALILLLPFGLACFWVRERNATHHQPISYDSYR